MKTRMIMLVIMEKMVVDKKKLFYIQDKSYFHSETYKSWKDWYTGITLRMLVEIQSKISSY